MKKFMIVVVIVTMIALLGSVISFFVFDFGNILFAQTRTIQKSIVNESLTGWNTITSDISQFVEDIVSITEKSADVIADSAFDGFDAIMDSVGEEIGISDGYITVEHMTKHNKEIKNRYYKDIEKNKISKIVISTNNRNVILGKTTGKEISVYHVKSKHSESKEQMEVVLNEDGVYLISLREADKSGNYIEEDGVYVLIPKKFSAPIEIESVNGNVVTINSSNPLKVDVLNGNVVLKLLGNQPLDIKTENGNIVASLEEFTDYKLKAETQNGVIVGLDSIPTQKLNRVKGNGNPVLNFSSLNGNIVLDEK